MTSYERVCRWLLLAFPADFRADRGDDLVVTLLDLASRMSFRSAADLLASGLRMRAVHAGAARGVRRSVGASTEIAAVTGIALQAAVAVASAVFFLQHGVLFYLNGPNSRGSVVGAQHPAVWVAAAVVAVAALVAALRGRRGLAAMGSAAVTGYSLVVAGVMVHAEHAVQLAGSAAGSLTPVQATAGGTAVPAAGIGLSSGPSSITSMPFAGGAFSFRYQDFVSTPALLAIGVVASAAALVVVRRRPSSVVSDRRTWVWLGGTASLAALLALVGDGSGASGSWPNISYSIPPQGGVMTAFQCLWAVGIIAGLLWGRFDPRVGWATAALSIPFIAYQISALTIGASYYGELYQPWWRTDLPLLAAVTAVVALTATSVHTSRRLQRL
jgi:hypothetical protein